MEFYLDNQKIDTIVNGVVINETLDETLYTASVVLSLNEQKEAIKPYTPFKIVNGGETFYFVVASDDVELESKSPLMFKHSLKLIEETEILKIKDLQNTICAQPSRNKSVKVISNGEYDEPRLSNTLSIKPYEKINKIMLEVDTYKIYETYRGSKPAVGNIPISMEVAKINARAKIVVRDKGVIIYETERQIDEHFEKIIDKGNFNALTVEVRLLKPLNTGTKIEIYSVFARLKVETYYYSLLDVLNLIKKRSGDTFIVSNEISDLNSVVAPNFAFTENNVFNAVNEVFSFVDGRAFLRNGELTIKYFNERKEAKVLEEDLTGYKSSLSSEKYANGLVSKFQNAGTETHTFYPSDYNFAKAKPTDLGVPTDTGWAFVVDKKIRYLEKLVVVSDVIFGLTDNIFDYNIKMDGVELDVSDYTFEDTNYLQLPKLSSVNFDDLMNKNLQNNSFHYKSGSNEINYLTTSKTIIGTEVYGVGFALYRAFREQIFKSDLQMKKYSWDGFSVDEKNIKFNAKFYPYVDGKLIIEQAEEKANGVIRLSQANGATNINRMGQNLFGQLLRMGNEERVVTPKITSFDKRFKCGDTYDKEWLVNKSSTTILKDFSFQTLQLTKNYNKISNFIRLNQVKRFNEIDSSVVGKSETIIKEYVYFDLQDFTNTSDLTLNLDYFKNGLLATFNGAEFVNNLDVATFKNDEINYFVKIPMLTYGSGNALCFEFSFDSPISAGTQLVQDEAFYGSKYFSKYCLYADENGRFDNFNIQVGYWEDELITHQKAGVVLDKLPFIGSQLDVYFGSKIQLSWHSLLTINGNVEKQANEIFALNYEILFLSKNTDLFIGNHLLTNNKLVNNILSSDNYLYFSDTLYSVMDTHAKGTKGSKVNAVISGNKITFGTAQTCKAWAIANANGELLLSVNKAQRSGESLFVYFSCSRKRL